MKTYTIIPVVLFLLSSCNLKKEQEITVHKMKYAEFVKTDTMDYDFGVIKEVDGVVNHDFSFFNTNDSYIYISVVPVVCPCLQVKYPKGKIETGERFTISVSYNPENRNGYFNRHIMIVLNNGEYYINPTIKGIVE